MSSHESTGELVVLVACGLAIFACVGILRPPLGAGELYRAAVSAELVAALAMVVLAKSGLPYRRRRPFMWLLKAAAWASFTGILFRNAAVVLLQGGGRLPGSSSNDIVAFSALFSAVMAVVFVAKEVYGEA